MLAPRTIPIPPPSLVDFGSFSDSSPLDRDYHGPQTQRFPHTRAQLSAINKQYRDNYESDAEDEAISRISSDFVLRIVRLLDAEHEEQLKAVLRDTYPGVDDEAVGCYAVYTSWSLTASA